MKTRLNLVAALIILVGPAGASGQFVRGRIFVSVSEVEACDFGGREWIVEIDPDTGDWSIFADSVEDELCIVSGLRFTSDGGHLLALNAGHLEGEPDGGWVLELDVEGNGRVILDESDGFADHTEATAWLSTPPGICTW